jgi:hypothetical protein
MEARPEGGLGFEDMGKLRRLIYYVQGSDFPFTPVQLKVIRAKYLEDGQLASLAREMGVSKPRISQILQSALGKLRTAATELGITESLDLLEAGVSRREFLRHTGAAGTALASGPNALLKMILGSDAKKYISAINSFNRLSDDMKEDVDEFVFWLINESGWSGGNQKWRFTEIRDGMVYENGEPQFPLSAIIGNNIVHGGTDNVMTGITTWLTGENPEIYEHIMPGIIGDMLKVASKGDMSKLGGALTQYAESEGTFVLQYWQDALRQIPDLAKHFGISPTEATSAMSGNLDSLRKMINNNVINKDQAREIVQWHRDTVRKTAEWKREHEETVRKNTAEYERQKRETEDQPEKTDKPEELEQYRVHPDARLASSMHQPFERRYFNDRLNQILEATYVDEPTDVRIELGGSLMKTIDYNPTSGQVSIDGHDMASIAKSMPMMFLRMARFMRVIHGSLGGGKFETFDGQQIDCSPLMYRTRQNQQMWDSCIQEILDAVSRFFKKATMPQGAV